MKVGFVQFAPVFGNKQENFRAVGKLPDGIKADLLVLPELFATGYAFTSAEEVDGLAEETGEETTRFMAELSVSCNSAVVGGFVERDGLNCYNSALLTDPSGLIRTYRKIQLFNKEKLWFSPGNKAPEVIISRGMKIGIMICFDWAFPEVCRTLALKGLIDIDPSMADNKSVNPFNDLLKDRRPQFYCI